MARIISFSMIETIISMIIVSVVFLLSVSIISNLSSGSTNLDEFYAEAIIDNEISEIKKNNSIENYIKNEEQYSLEVKASPAGNEAYILRVSLMNMKGQLIFEKKIIQSKGDN